MNYKIVLPLLLVYLSGCATHPEPAVDEAEEAVEPLLVWQEEDNQTQTGIIVGNLWKHDTETQHYTSIISGKGQGHMRRPKKNIKDSTITNVMNT